MARSESLIALYVIELQGDSELGLQVIAFEGPGFMGTVRTVLPMGTMPGRRFRVTVEALDVTDKLEAS